MNRRLSMSAALLTLLCIVLAYASCAEGQTTQFQHGHLVNLPVLYIDGEPFWSKDFAFLAVKLEIVPEQPEAVTYLQSANYFEIGGETFTNATIQRTVWTSEAYPDGWLLLPLRKPCAPGQSSTSVGAVIVCPPRKKGEGAIGSCASQDGPLPIWSEVPEERVSCGGTGKRRAVRQ